MVGFWSTDGVHSNKFRSEGCLHYVRMMETDGFLYFQNMTPRTLIEMYARFFWPVAERGIMKPKSNMSLIDPKTKIIEVQLK